MVSAQILVGEDGAEAVLDDDGLRLVDRRTRTQVPLAVVQEVRSDGGRHVEIVLTDGVLHRVDGGNPTAATAFANALGDALPAQRDPAGSAAVRVTDLTPQPEPEQPVYHPKYRRRQLILLALVLTYAGYTTGVGVALGADKLPAPLGAVIPLALGAALLILALDVTLVYYALKKRGITVNATFDFQTKDKAAWYKYTSLDGVEHSGRGKNRGPVTRVAYDPDNPRDYSFDSSGTDTLRRICPPALAALPLLALGIYLALTPFLVN
ncbi:hypothetical protein [Streptomyces sp. NPDC003635]